MSALSLLKINSPSFPDAEQESKTPFTPSPNAAELFSPRYNINRRNSTSTIPNKKMTPSGTVTPSTVSRRFGRRLSVPAVVQYPERNIAYKLPTAMLHHIIQFVDFESPAEIVSIELVCRQFKKAMVLEYPTIKVAWERLLIKQWGSSAATFDELQCKLNAKHIYERRFLQTSLPIQLTNSALKKFVMTCKDLEELEVKDELELVSKKLPAQIERGRVEHYLATVKTGYALENVSAVEEKSASTPAFNVALIRGLFSKNETEVRESVVQYRQMLSVVNGNPSIDMVISAKVVPQFIKLLRHARDHVLKFEVTWVLTNICSGSSSNVAEVVNAGAIPFLVEAIHNRTLPIDDVFIEQAIWALGNICGDSQLYCEKVLDHEPLPILTTRLLSSDIAKLRVSFLRNTCWFLSNCVRSRPRAPFWKVRKIVDVFAETSKLQDLDVLCDTLWGVSYVCEDIKEEEAKYLLKRIKPKHLLKLIQHQHGMVCTPAFNAIMHLVKANQYSRSMMLKEGLLETLAFIAKARNGTGRVFKMCLDMYKAVLSHSHVDELKKAALENGKNFREAAEYLETKVRAAEEAAAAAANPGNEAAAPQ